ncbi:nicotinamide riboside transporter PnuC [Mucilaginibacter myungsuensis]|uniref:Nicotinamide riboside transporter PnuC n=1 Tax=Mucilaginibacter myungsuensis TaxID=649104 RepID=A0A929PWT0_9SPHI|nr:nicotinamide riboside transporter PnuC [Mucilaginibacter myungsuensis]MBE9661670.1 nicotinamide mononucleotide transporter [Mucilaginibacter myungsuensis]MDN3597814.1 nicotinamide riboside transporter PnuC [Mucilaginibacter myungsuensis]
MNIHPWIQLFIDQIKLTTPWEWAAVILGVTEVVLAKMNKIWLYPVGIAGILISMSVLIGAHLYAETALNVYYLVMSIYGWYYWIKKKHEPPVKISWSTRKEWVTTILIVLVGWAALYGFNFLPQLIHVKYTPSNVPLWDAWVAATAWAGMWLLAKRKIENWVLLNISNLFAIPLLFYKGLAMFAVLTLILFIVAIFGFLQWIRIWRADQLKPAEQQV